MHHISPYPHNNSKYNPISFSTNTRFLETIRKYYRDPNLDEGTSSSNILGYTASCKEFGIVPKRNNKNHRYFYYNGTLIGKLIGMRPSITSAAASAFCKNKARTSTHLNTFGKICPEANQFSLDDKGLRDAFTYWKAIRNDFDVVVKPSHGEGGIGITVGISSEAELINAWHFATQNVKHPNETVIIEERVDGCDFRVVVVQGKTECACVRVPAYVVGDGAKTISDLVREKNKVRNKHPHHKRYPIPLPTGPSAETIPCKDETMFLSTTANIHQGGESFDITDFLPDEVKRIAEIACQSIPGLGSAGVDIIYSGNNETQPKIIEINTSPNFGIHYYPMYGPKRNPARSIIMDMLQSSL